MGKKLFKWILVSGIVALLPIWYVWLINLGQETSQSWPLIVRHGELILVAVALAGESVVDLGFAAAR